MIKIKPNKILVLVSVFISAAVIFTLTVMGFFSKLFSNKSDGNQTSVQMLPATGHQADWAAYLTKIDNDSVGSIIVDLGLRQVVPIDNRQFCLRVDIKLNNPNADGLYSNAESAKVGEIDESLESVLAKDLQSIYAGHLIHDGTLYLYHYLGQVAEAERIVAKTMAEFPEYTFSTKIDNDGKWDTYLQLLYPEPIQMQSIQNGRVVESLRSQGDKLEKTRLVEHWLYFKTEADRERFLKSIEGLGFTIESKHKAPMGDSDFALRISRFDTVTHQSVDDYTLDLWQKANDINGEYDGWETEVVRD